MNETGSSPNITMNVREIQDQIPHRYPFLLVDRISSLIPMESVDAQKAVSALDPYLQGHFPGNPVMPGVLMIEAMAQASAILGKMSKGQDCHTCLLTEVTESRFRRIVTPGDILNIHVKVLKHRKDFFWFEGQATVDGDLAAFAKFTAKLA